jgi:hypothetical protein
MLPSTLTPLFNTKCWTVPRAVIVWTANSKCEVAKFP